ncbi:SAM-dependent methyltransferase [Colletotrichum orchidophilum]|uniref:SAM-dependent methyltransferase n=1 Tax=Colletotrichum orchidophilum TaxID=1209926 RepID=A0A1G4B411_9PEZI|nr:SAM-dependent methyltransferase [Colletotrichum orchidophilum]OHE96168.1 SAM-dependent methyltransferase [Colletotrichum orchidophilum]
MSQSHPEAPSQTLLFSLAESYPHSPSQLHTVIIPQLTHRLRLSTLWSIAPGTRVLDIGCGQGDSALVLSHAVAPPSTTGDGNNTTHTGPAPVPGHVTALDPAPGAYGSPFTLAQAQSHISSSPHGAHITFHQSDAPSYLASHSAETFDSATLCHSLWYFSSGAAISSLFDALYTSSSEQHQHQIKRLCFAEYAFKARTPAQKPHEMAVAAQKRFYALQADKGFTLDQGNIRGALDPEEILALAEKAGWRLKDRGVVDTPGLLDGQWEVAAVLDPSWAEGIIKEGLGKEAEEELLGYVSDIQAAVSELKKTGDKATTMDAVWVVMER